MLDPNQVSAPMAGEIAGDARALAAPLGAAEENGPLSAAALSFHWQRVTSLPELRRFLHNYESQILLPHELPSIEQAFFCANHNELRELIALDRRLQQEPLLKNFVVASRFVGKSQLRRLRPLRDQRLAQRYCRAVEIGEAAGWHTLVYGIVLAIYSLPLRSGLLSFGQQTMQGFIASAGRALRLPEKDCQDLSLEICAHLPEAVESVLTTKNPVELLVI